MSAVGPTLSLLTLVIRAAKLRLFNFLSLFRDLQKPTRFSGGEGVVAFFLKFFQEPTRFSGGGGGGSSRIFSAISCCEILFLHDFKWYSWVETHICLNTTKIRISSAKINCHSNSLNSGSFLYNSGRPGGHAPFLETTGNSGRLGRSESLCS